MVHADVAHGLHVARAGRRANQLEAAGRILAALSDASDFGVAAQRVCSLFAEIFDATWGEIAVVGPEGADTWVVASSTSQPALGAADGAEEAELHRIQPAAAPGQLLIRDLEALAEADAPVARATARGIRSFIRVACTLAEGGLVVFSLGSREPGAFDHGHAQLLAEISEPAVGSLARLLELEQLRDCADVLRAEARIRALLRPDTTVEEVAEAYMREARQLFGASHASFVQLSRRSPGVIGLSSDHLSPAEFSGFRAPLDHPGLALLGPSGAILHLRGGERHPIAQLEYARGLRTLLHVPICRSDGTLLAISSVGSVHPRAYRQRHLALLVELSRAVGGIAERAELLGQARVRSEQVASLSRLMNAMHARAEPHDVAQAFARELHRSLNARLLAIAEFEPESGQHTVLASVPDQSEHRPFDAVALAESFQWMQTQPTARYDATEPESAPPWLARASRELGLASAIAIRLEANGVPLGMVVAAAREADWLGEAELRVLANAAPPLAMLLERAHLVSTLAANTRRTSSILGLLEAFGPGASLDELANPLATAVRNLFQADASAVMLRDARGLRIAAIDSDDPSLRGVRARRELRGEQAWPTKRRLLRNLQAAPEPLDPLARLMRDRGYGACVTVPVGPSSPIQCAVTLASRTPGAFTEQDGRQLAQTLRPVEVAVAYFAGKRAAVERERRLETTNRILGRFARGGSPAGLATAFAQECAELFGCAAAVVFRQEPGADQATVLGGYSNLPVGKGLATLTPLGSVGEPLGAEQDRMNPVEEEMTRRGIADAIRVPLLVGDAVWGGVEIWATRAGHFSGEDRNLLEALASPLALGLEKAMALEALAESELKYRSVVAQAEEMILLLDVQSGRIVDANPYAARALGYSPAELLQLGDGDISGPGTSGFVAGSVEGLLDDVELRLSDRQFRRRDGSLLEVDIVATVVSFGGRRALLVMARDMSERKAMQRQLMQAQKMESLGELAGAVAHDFNNLLTTILGFAGILKLAGQLDDENRENVGLIEDAARRGADLTSRLLSFSRGGLIHFGPVDLRVVVADTLRLAGPTLSLRFQVETTAPENPVMVEGDEGQLQQAMLNIILNARDAMPEGGRIAIKLEVSEGQAVLSIADNGPGMNDEVRLRVFEPFFTTKPAGSGTGLGLAITYGIVQGHHGRILLESAEGAGSRFTISLPLAGAAPADGPARTLLIVDDDELVRRTSNRLLGVLGFAAEEASNGADAIELIASAPQRYSGVILDLVMPGLSGNETLGAIRQIRPDMPVVICSAFAPESFDQEPGSEGRTSVLPKPFTPQRLAAALEQAGIAAPSAALAFSS